MCTPHPRGTAHALARGHHTCVPSGVLREHVQDVVHAQTCVPRELHVPRALYVRFERFVYGIGYNDLRDHSHINL